MSVDRIAARMPNGEKVATAALAYRIWCAASAADWNLTLADLAATLNEPEARVRRIAQLRNWLRHLRVAERDTSGCTGDVPDLTDLGIGVSGGSMVSAPGEVAA